MAARAGTGTAVGLAVATGSPTTNAVVHRRLNNTYRVEINKATNLLSLTRNGVACFTSITQSEFQQLWQDMAQLGATN